MIVNWLSNSNRLICKTLIIDLNSKTYVVSYQFLPDISDGIHILQGVLSITTAKWCWHMKYILQGVYLSQQQGGVAYEIILQAVLSITTAKWRWHMKYILQGVLSEDGEFSIHGGSDGL